jgi:gliding motility-associated-like protein
MSLVKFFFLGLLLLFLCYDSCIGQIIYKQGFNGCNLGSSIGLAISNGSLKCGCGIPDQSMELNGINDGLTLPDSLLKLMKNDYTIDFYIDINNETQDQVDLMSITNECDIDSTIAIKYLKLNNEILVELLLNKGQYFPIKGKIDNRCWNRITLVKNKLNYVLYINNIEAGRSIIPQNVPLSDKAKFAFSNSPCLKTIDDRIFGRIDEITVYNGALDRNDLLRSYSFPDRIRNRDTSIFIGDQVLLEYPNTCSTNLLWQPDDEIIDVKDGGKRVLVQPTKNTTFIVEASDDGCISYDSTTVYVLDPEKQKCENLLLPQAFTPNGDNINDEFKISNFFIVEELKDFTILNRWGEVIETISGKENGWTGQKRGVKAESGSYVYRINYTCKGKEYNKMGSFFLMK